MKTIGLAKRTSEFDYKFAQQNDRAPYCYRGFTLFWIKKKLQKLAEEVCLSCEFGYQIILLIVKNPCYRVICVVAQFRIIHQLEV